MRTLSGAALLLALLLALLPGSAMAAAPRSVELDQLKLGGTTVTGIGPGSTQLAPGPVAASALSLAGAAIACPSGVACVAPLHIGTSDPNIDQLCVDFVGNSTPYCDRLFNKTTGAITALPGFTVYKPSYSGGVTSPLQAVLDRVVNIDDAGAVGDGVTDDTNAEIIAANKVAVGGGRVLLTQGKRYHFGAITLPQGVTLDCGISGVGNFGGQNAAQNYAGMGGILLTPTTGNIKTSGNSGVQHCFIAPYGMTFPQVDSSAWSGKALSIGSYGSDSHFNDDMVIGFNQLVGYADATPLAVDRIKITNFLGDGNTGIFLEGSFDTSVVQHDHFFPFATIGYNGGNPPASSLSRTGKAVELAGQSDETILDDVFAFAYAQNYYLHSNGNVIGGIIWSDGLSTAPAGSIGFEFGDNIDRSTFSAIYAHGYSHSIDFDQGNGVVTVNNLFGSNTVPGGECVSFSSGKTHISLINLAQCAAYAIDIGSAAARLQILGGSISYSQGYTPGGTPVSAAYIALPPGADTEHVKIGPIITDQAAGASLYGANQLHAPAVAASFTLMPPSTWTHDISLTGNGTIGVIQGAWGGRELVLTNAPSSTARIAEATSGNGGNVALSGGVAWGGAAGWMIGLKLDPETGLWREQWRSQP